MSLAFSATPPPRCSFSSINITFGSFLVLLAILKSGAAYVPIDPTFPPDRIRHTLNNANPKLAVVSSETSKSLAAWTCQLRWYFPAIWVNIGHLQNNHMLLPVAIFHCPFPFPPLDERLRGRLT